MGSPLAPSTVQKKELANGPSERSKCVFRLTAKETG